MPSITFHVANDPAAAAAVPPAAPPPEQQQPPQSSQSQPQVQPQPQPQPPQPQPQRQQQLQHRDPDEVAHRIRWVRLPRTTPDAPPPTSTKETAIVPYAASPSASSGGDDAAAAGDDSDLLRLSDRTHIWWPALLYRSSDELQRSITGKSKAVTQLKSRLLRERRAYQKEKKGLGLRTDATGMGVAHLFGPRTPTGTASYPVPYSSLDDDGDDNPPSSKGQHPPHAAASGSPPTPPSTPLVVNFFDHIDLLEQHYESTATDGSNWSRAKNVAFDCLHPPPPQEDRSPRDGGSALASASSGAGGAVKGASPVRIFDPTADRADFSGWGGVPGWDDRAAVAAAGTATSPADAASGAAPSEEEAGQRQRETDAKSSSSSGRDEGQGRREDQKSRRSNKADQEQTAAAAAVRPSQDPEDEVVDQDDDDDDDDSPLKPDSDGTFDVPSPRAASRSAIKSAAVGVSTERKKAALPAIDEEGQLAENEHKGKDEDEEMGLEEEGGVSPQRPKRIKFGTTTTAATTTTTTKTTKETTAATPAATTIHATPTASSSSAPKIKGTPINPTEAWIHVWSKLEFSGWTRVWGTGLMEDYYYICPGGKTRSRGGVEGTDYWCSAEGVREYCRVNYGWGGGEEGEDGMEGEDTGKSVGETTTTATRRTRGGINVKRIGTVAATGGGQNKAAAATTSGAASSPASSSSRGPIVESSPSSRNNRRRVPRQAQQRQRQQTESTSVGTAVARSSGAASKVGNRKGKKPPSPTKATPSGSIRSHRGFALNGGDENAEGREEGAQDVGEDGEAKDCEEEDEQYLSAREEESPSSRTPTTASDAFPSTVRTAAAITTTSTTDATHRHRPTPSPPNRGTAASAGVAAAATGAAASTAKMGRDDATPPPPMGSSRGENKDNGTKSRQAQIQEKKLYLPPTVEWKSVLPTLYDAGWGYKPGTGLVAYYYVTPRFKHESLGYMRKYGVRGKDYFCTMGADDNKELESFVRKTYGWVGPDGSVGVGSPASSTCSGGSGFGAYDRVKKSSRRGTRVPSRSSSGVQDAMPARAVQRKAVTAVTSPSPSSSSVSSSSSFGIVGGAADASIDFSDEGGNEQRGDDEEEVLVHDASDASSSDDGEEEEGKAIMAVHRKEKEKKARGGGVRGGSKKKAAVAKKSKVRAKHGVGAGVTPSKRKFNSARGGRKHNGGIGSKLVSPARCEDTPSNPVRRSDAKAQRLPGKKPQPKKTKKGAAAAAKAKKSKTKAKASAKRAPRAQSKRPGGTKGRSTTAAKMPKTATTTTAGVGAKSKSRAPKSPQSISSPTSASSSSVDYYQDATILRDQDAFRLLMKHFKFRQVGPYYCLPVPGGKVNPVKSDDYTEGRDYFGTLSELRKNVCAFGIPVPKNKENYVEKTLSSEERGALRKWVRYAVVDSIRVGMTDEAVQSLLAGEVDPIPPDRFMGKDGAWQLFQKLGYTWSGNYRIPGAKRGVMGLDGAGMFHESSDLQKHLSRFGIVHAAHPGGGASSKGEPALSSTDRLRLELFVTRCPHVETFERIESREEDYAWLKRSPPPSGATPAKAHEATRAEPSSSGKKDEPAAAACSEDIDNRATMPAAKGEILPPEEITLPSISVNSAEAHSGELSASASAAVRSVASSVSPLGSVGPSRKGRSPRSSSAGVGRNESPESSHPSASSRLSLSPSSNGPDERGNGVTTQPDAEFRTSEGSPGMSRVDSLVEKLCGGGSRNSIDSYIEAEMDNVEEEKEMISPSNENPTTQPETNDGADNADDGKENDAAVAGNGQSTPAPNGDKRLVCDGSNEKPVPCDDNLQTPAQNAQSSSSPENNSSALSPQILEAKKRNQELKDTPMVKDPSKMGSPVQSNDHWKVVYDKLKASGWEYTTGGKLNEWDYIMPTGKSRAKGGIEGVDFFTSLDDVKKFALTHLGWGGDDQTRALISTACGDRPRRQRTVGAALKEESRKKEQRTAPSNKRKLGGAALAGKEKKARVEAAEVTTQSSARRISAKKDNNVDDRSSCSDDATKPSLPDMQGTIGEKLRCCRSVLHSEDVTELAMTSGTSRFRSNVKVISDFFDGTTSAFAVPRKGGRKKAFQPSTMYVCGAPGTGKTTTLRDCIKVTGEKGDAQFLFINVTSCGADVATASKSILQQIAEEMRVSDAQPGKIEKRLCFSPERDTRNPPLILILDEIDILISSGPKNGAGDRLVETLLRWAANPHCAFALIGISNSVDSGPARRLKELGTISKHVVFSPYTEKDLTTIVQQRVGRRIIAEPALQFVCRKVAATSGDARSVLDMTAKAVRKCEESLSSDQLDSTDMELPVVKLPHMMRSIREGLGMKHTEAIAGLPQAAKIVLCVAMALSQVSPAWKVIKMGTLKKYCSQASHHGLMEHMNIDHLYDLVQMLCDSGLLLTGTNAPGQELRGQCFGDVYDIPLQLGVQLDDVECALEKTLMSEKFYSALVAYVTKHHSNRQW